MRVIILSDLHIKPENTVESLAWVKHFCDFMKSGYATETLIFVLGDIIDKGELYGKEAFDAAEHIFSYITSELASVQYRIEFIPGNHDYCKRNLDLFTLFCSHCYNLLDPGIDFSKKSTWNYSREKFNFVLVDSVQNGDYSKPGHLDLEQVEACLQSDKKNIILMHHSLFFEDGSDHTGIVNQPQAFDFLRKNNIQFVFHGHAHATRKYRVDEGIQQFGIGSLGLEEKDLEGLPNEREQFLEVKFNSIGIERVVNWQWRGGEQEYLSTILYPQMSPQYENGIFISRQKYEKPMEYIDRQVMLREFAAEDAVTRALLYDNKKSSLIEACEADHYVLLIADAGLGKTIEMENLAHIASAKAQNQYPVFLPLYTYSDEPIEDYVIKLVPEYKTLDPNSFFLIIDGFDEVSEPKEFKLSLTQFMNRFPSAQICISMRSNFLQRNSRVFDKYKIYQLLELEMSDIEAVLCKNSIEVSDFLKQCAEKDLQGLIRTPFYLNSLIKIAQKNKVLPSKGELMDQLVNIHFSEDAKKFEFALPFSMEDSEYELMQALKRFACGLQLLNVPILDDASFQFVLEERDRNYIKYSSLSVKVKDGRCFSHNNFKEFFVAKWLVGKSKEDILKYITVPQTRTLNPSWFNVLSLVLFLDEREDLQEWILKTKPLLLTRLEADKVSEDLRFSILEMVLTDIVDRNVWFSHAECSEEDLARFSQSPRSLKLLLDHIQSPAHFRSLNFCLRVLFYFPQLYCKEESARKILVCCYQSDSVRPHEKRVAIPSIAALNLDTAEITEDIVSRFAGNSSSDIRHGVYEYLLKTGNVNEHVTFLLDGIRYISYSYPRTEGTNASENLALTNCLNTINNPQALQKVIQWFCDDKNLLMDFYGKEKLQEKFFETAVCLYLEGHVSLYETVYDFLIYVAQKQSAKDFQLGWNFFVKTSTSEKAFIALVNEDLRFMVFLISDIIRTQPEILDLFCNLYSKDELRTPSLLKEYALYMHRNPGIFTMCAKTILAKTGESIQPPELPDYEQKSKADSQALFDSLFCKTQFKDLLSQLVSFYNDPEITLNKIKEIRSWSGEYPVGTQRLELALLRSGLDDIRLVDFLEYINWDTFSIGEICILLEEKSTLNGLTISSEQYDFLETKYHNLETSIDYHSSVLEEPDNTLRFSINIQWYMTLQTAFTWPAPADFYLGLLEIPYFFIQDIESLDAKYELIEKHISRIEITRQIEALVYNETRPSVLSELLAGCMRYKSTFGREAAEKLCHSDSMPAWRRREALLYLIEVFGTDYILDELLPTIDEPLFEIAIDQFTNNDDKRINKELVRRFRIAPNTFLMKHLIVRNIPDGLQACINALSKAGCIRDQYGEGGEVVQAIGAIRDGSLLPLLTDALRLSFSDNFIDGEFFSLAGALRSAFYACSKSDYELVNQTLEKLKVEFAAKPSALSYCNMLQDDIKSTNELSFIKKYSKKEVKQILYNDTDL